MSPKLQLSLSRDHATDGDDTHNSRVRNEQYVSYVYLLVLRYTSEG